MRIGIVTTWFERGGAYVSRAYMDNLVLEGHEVSIYARGGETTGKGDSKWDLPNVTWGKELRGGNINHNHFFSWIENRDLEAILFNEQANFRIVVLTKKKYPNIKLCSYIDYYTEKTIPYFNVFDFVICNTKRHMQAMINHPQRYYLRWGTDTDLFKPVNAIHDKIVFFHSVGMSSRKGTDVLLDAFIYYELYKKAKLVIHTQIPIEKVSNYSAAELSQYGIEIIEKTIPAPGLYYMGDVYVYPTRLDGLGLTMYEALSSGLPVIATDYPPMNEVVNNDVGRLVSLERNYCRQDAYYWPMSICDRKSLAEAIVFYIDNPDILKLHKANARKVALDLYEWKSHSKELSDIFLSSEVRSLSKEEGDRVLKVFDKGKLRNWARENEFMTKIYNLIRREG